MKKFTITISDDGEVAYESDGMADFEAIGIMQLIEADLRVRFASLNAQQRAGHTAHVLALEDAARDAKAEAASWKERARKHGCDVENGDPDCG